MKRICISVDVEEDLPGIVRWSTMGIDIGLPRLLDFLDENRLRADFFFLSTIAKAKPDIVSRIANAGHGIGNHGLDHTFLCRKAPLRQEWEIRQSTKVLEEIVSKRPSMYRAAGFSADDVTLGILQKNKYAIDSSILPGRRARRFRVFPVYDHRRAPKDPYYPTSVVDDGGNRLLEVPVTENPMRPGAPLGLGAVNTFGPERLLSVLRLIVPQTVVFLVHPWELLDIHKFHPRAPEGYVRACSANLDPLREFFEEARDLATFTTLAAVQKDFKGT